MRELRAGDRLRFRYLGEERSSEIAEAGTATGCNIGSLGSAGTTAGVSLSERGGRVVESFLGIGTERNMVGDV